MVKSIDKSIGLLGGSFDPPHKGHLEISKIAIKKFKLSKMLWIVTKQNPFKKKPLYPVQRRLIESRKIVKKIKKIKVVHLDKIAGSSRTIDVVNYLIKKEKLKKIYFIIGSDSLIKFHKWKSWKKLVKLVKLIVFSRKGYDKKSNKSKVVKYLKNKIVFVNNTPISVSSTNLKKKKRIIN